MYSGDKYKEKLHKRSIIKQNILHYIDSVNITKYSFYKKTGITRGILDQDTGISEDNIAKFIAYFPEINTEWLLTGIGNMIKNDLNLKYVVTDVRPNKVSGVPFYENLPSIAGDIPTYIMDAKPTSFIDLPQLSDCIAVLPVYGSSMKGVIEPGDLIAIKEVLSRNQFDPALPYLVVTDEHRMVKFLRTDEIDKDIIWAESSNHSRIKLHVDIIKMVYAIKCVVRFF